MAEAAGAGGVVSGDVPVTTQQVAVGHQPLQANGATGRQGLGADADLGAKAVAEAIGKARGAVVIDPSAIDAAQERLRRCAIRGANALGVP